MRVAIDTNRLTDLFRGDAELAEWLGGCDEVCVPLPVLAEIKAGFAGGSRRHYNETVLREFLSKSTVQVLLASRETAEHYARLVVQLKTAGTPIPINVSGYPVTRRSGLPSSHLLCGSAFPAAATSYI